MQGQGNGGGSRKACDAEATGQLMMLLGLGAKPADDAVDQEATCDSVGDDDKADTEQEGNGGDEEGRSAPHGGEFPEPSMENSVGFKMLAKMGWNKDKGLGKMGNGIIDPVEACGQNVYGSKGAGLRHASEMLYAEKQKRPEEMEAWEIEEKTEDWFRGSKSSMWLPAGLLEDQDKNFKSSVAKQEEATITRYEDAWEDREMGRLMGGGIDHTEEDWEDAWDAGLQMDLDTESLNSELFFSCSVVLGSRVRLLQVEPTGEVFQHFLWAHDSNSLRTALEHKLDDKLRVLRPLIRGEGAQRRTIYGILSRGGLGQHNREAEKIQGVKVRLMGPMWLLCRSGGRYIRDYALTDYIEDILRGQDSS